MSAQAPSERPFDYTHYAEILQTHVDDRGMVNYKRLKANPDTLLSYVNATAALLEDADRRDVLNADFRVKYLDYDWSLTERKG